MQYETAKFFRSPDTESFRGVLGAQKIKGTIYYNAKTRVATFINARNNHFRTIGKFSGKQFRNLMNTKHMFPTAGSK